MGQKPNVIAVAAVFFGAKFGPGKYNFITSLATHSSNLYISYEWDDEGSKLKMINAIRFANRAQPPPSVLSNPSPYRIARNSSAVDIRYRKIVTSAGQPDNNMDPTKKPEQDKAVDTMSSIYGDAYATRSDEEGFGGIYGGNKEDEENIKQGKAPEYETKQGSEVEEKEKACNQRQAA